MQLFQEGLAGEILTHLLTSGALHTTKLIEEIQRKQSCTRQGVYRVLRKLKAEEKVIWHNATVGINNLWRERLERTLKGTHEGAPLIGDVRSLKEGDRLSLRVRGLSTADQIWSHVFVSVEQSLPTHSPLYLYNPHNWTLLLREETDRVHLERLEQSQRPTYLLVGATALDKAVTATMQSPYLEHSYTSRRRFSSSVAIIGAYIFELRLVGAGNERIETVFTAPLDMVAAKARLTKLDPHIVCRILVEHNRKKASAWKKRIAQDFLIPKKFRDF